MIDQGWRQVWEERGTSYPHDDASKIAGFDQGFSQMPAEAVERAVGDVVACLGLSRDSRVLELGCGTGMVLRPLADHARVIGFDLAFAMVRRGRQLWPEMAAAQADSVRLPARSASFDGAFAHAVFLYFPDYEYTESVLDEMARVVRPGGRFMVSDLTDADNREEYLRMRTEVGQREQPTWRSSVTAELQHLYFTRRFFTEWGASRGCRVDCRDRDIPGYLNGRYRFDVVVSV